MKYANETYFLVCTILLSGIAVASLPYLQKNRLNKSYYLEVALGFHIGSFFLFVITSSTFSWLLTIANTALVSGYFFLGLFCRSLNGSSGKKIISLFPILLIIFGSYFEYLRELVSFQARVILILCAIISCLIWILTELYQARKKAHFIQIDFLIVTIVAEIVLDILRLYFIVFGDTLGKIDLYQEPYTSALIRWIAIACTVLSYISIVGYLSEKLTRENAKNIYDNNRVTALLNERETLIANLLKANRTAATGALSASLAHELNQPLGASTLNIQFLKLKLGKGLLSPEVGMEVLSSLETDNKRAATIVKSLRSIFSDEEYCPQVLNVGQLISIVLNIVKPQLKSSHIQIEFEAGEDLLIQGISGEIEQVMINLINNAIQSLLTSEVAHARISIEVKKDGRYVNISIADNGRGVPPKFKEHLFELLNTTKRSGMGLGLWLCKHIVTRSGGTIWYEDAQGGGAKFNLKIPLAH